MTKKRKGRMFQTVPSMLQCVPKWFKLPSRLFSSHCLFGTKCRQSSIMLFLMNGKN